MLETVWTGVFGVGLVLWLLASVVHQLQPKCWTHVISYDCFRLLPQWHFFAPNPGREDYHLLIRDLVNGRAAPWREVYVGEAHQAWRWLWNPPRFRQKALIDLVSHLQKARRVLEDGEVVTRAEQLSLPYLGLLAWVTAQPSEHLPCLRQFALVASAGHGDGRDLRVIYVSEVHTVLEDGRAA